MYYKDHTVLLHKVDYIIVSDGVVKGIGKGSGDMRGT